MNATPAPIGEMNLADLRKYLTPDEYEELVAALNATAGKMVFFPTPKQQMVVDSKADIVGYGGAAGGGKSYLLTGLMTLHQRSAIVRPQKNQTKKFVQELQKMLRTREGYSQQQSNWTFTTPDGVERYAEFYGLDNPGDEEKQQGVDFDLKGYDEVTQMREEDIRYTLTWNRTDDPAQRVRAVLTFNPPTTDEGRWVLKFFGPWLDKHHPNPAKDGELRWFATVNGDRDYEVAGPQKFILKMIDGVEVPWYNFRADEHEPEDIITPKSRTFIRAKVTDNPYYMKTGYLSQLQSLPEPLRSMMMKGDFDAFVQDDARQVIPSSWIKAAQDRWVERNSLYKSGAIKRPPMDSLGVDASRGGNMGGSAVQMPNKGDEMVICPRYGTFFGELKTAKGIDCNDGPKAAALVVGERRDEAPVHLDIVGVGTSVFDFLTENKVHTIAINGASSPRGLDKSGLLRFFNYRSELYWRMREALDPEAGSEIALPPDPQMAMDLAAPRWVLGKQGIQVEGKDEIKKRLKRSTDRGDAIVYANVDTPKRMMIMGGMAGAPQTNWEQDRLRELES